MHLLERTHPWGKTTAAVLPSKMVFVGIISITSNRHVDSIRIFEFSIKTRFFITFKLFVAL